ncbi:glycosyltransferase family 15 protein [Mixia osmundae IAM 14324]|uniref:Glycosyltransferase family 15 protein n=1 Tax=Mixia osmundae (strain CBS 9802 / IAM 14324 / JCM 22182 / KY 12970) TaxID=764103 RepID=G7E2M4_MIXOS|nr:glycosyltransferase family 15 protein [Mixia osmundae IAM 14324]KEI36949.1 glycosyltransferase family 15 protein [Mixia osmundae IAM 14324]GAA97084.1 hypothetical protein E5Q_03759 [Mixia osmundae IAM 14324]
MMRNVEEIFNNKHQYPWVFLNEQYFSYDWRAKTTLATRAKTHYGLVPAEQWDMPEHINRLKQRLAMIKMAATGIPYGGRLSYRKMCRYMSGYIFRHPLLDRFEWYWRLEPDVVYSCQVKQDPFLRLERLNKTYGFVITTKDYTVSLPTLWRETMIFVKRNPQYLAKNNLMPWLHPNGSYSTCHFWSNFEIGRISFWRSEAYTKYFNHLEKAGGFFYERWAKYSLHVHTRILIFTTGDAPVHSLALGLFLPRDQVHYFDDIGYYHRPILHCPASPAYEEHQCTCNQSDSTVVKPEHQPFICFQSWLALNRGDEAAFRESQKGQRHLEF